MRTLLATVRADQNHAAFVRLLDAMAAAGSALPGLLDQPGTLTLFAPGNGALLQLAQVLGYNGLDPAEAADFLVALSADRDPLAPLALIEQILALHVANRPVTPVLIGGPTQVAVATLGGEIVEVGQGLLTDLNPATPPADLPGAARTATNGLLYRLDDVILPAGVVPLVRTSIDGTSGADVALGTFADDNIFGYEGNDRLRGGLGDDNLGGRSGADSLNGDQGHDLLFGGTGSDRLSGDDGNDTLWGGQGHDTLWGRLGDDILLGEAGNDLLIGVSGNDALDGGSGNDRLDGGAGLDVLRGGRGNDLLFGGADDDSLLGEAGHDRLHGGAGNDWLSGEAGDDTLIGDLGDDILTGGTGRNTLHGGTGQDRLFGGAEIDSLDGGAGNDLIEDIGGLGGTYSGGDGVDEFKIGFDYAGTIYAGAGNDDVLARAAALVFGGLGDDRIVVGDGDTTVFGGQGDDSLIFAGGDGTVHGGEGNDFIDMRDSGFDRLFGGGGDDIMLAGSDDDTADGGSGHDDLDGGRGNDLLIGGTGNDELIGAEGDDRIFGGKGNDNLSGGDGNDRIFGEEGNDRLWADSGDDRLSGGQGADLFAFRVGPLPTQGQDVVVDFVRGEDLLLVDLAGVDSPTFAEIAARLSQDGADTLIDMGSVPGQGIEWVRILNLDSTLLTQADFALF
jgi:Ca2+-binding RTX toxin-like protein